MSLPEGRGEVLKLADELGLELDSRDESFLLSLANWLTASDELEFVENYRTDWGLNDDKEDDDG